MRSEKIEKGLIEKDWGWGLIMVNVIRDYFGFINWVDYDKIIKL